MCELRKFGCPSSLSAASRFIYLFSALSPHSVDHHPGGISYTKGILNSTIKISGLRSFTLSVSLTHSQYSDETGPCAHSTLFDIAKPDELLEGGLDAYVLLRALERQIDRKVGVHKYEQLLDALAHLVV